MKANYQLTKNLLICGDNLEALDDLKKQGIEADLIYLDPPFFSNRHYEVVWGDEAEVRSFKDRWAGGINVYIEWMRERVIKMYDVLKDTGSFYLHCDWHASHYLKVMLDEVFGYHNFQNEIVWAYRTQGATKKRWSRKHDILLFYTKTNKWAFNYMTERSYMQHKYGFAKDDFKIDEEGRQYRNALIRDIWEITALQSATKEKLGYPTQKPEALLVRIIKASSNRDDLILDPFCGCGTTIAVAQQLNRKWIGIDISPTAIDVVERRLISKNIGAIKNKDFETTGMPTTLTKLKELKPREFQNWVIDKMKAKHSKKYIGDMGIDGYYDKTVFTDSAGIQVKQSEKVGRNVVDNFETSLRRAKYKKGYLVAYSFTKGVYEETARVKSKNGLEIKLVKVEELLHGKFKVWVE